MEHLSISVIKHFVEDHALVAYLIIILGILIEGEVIAIFAGIFAHLGSLKFPNIFLVLIIGGGLKSIIGYSIGYYLQKKHSHRQFLKQAEYRVGYFLPRFSDRPFWSLFLSRFLILSLHWFTLLMAGYKRIKIPIFAKAEAISLVVWSAVMLSLGFFFSFTAISISRDVRNFLGIILIFFISFFILEKIIAFIIELFEAKKVDNEK